MPSLICLNAILLAARTIGQCLASTIVVTYTDSSCTYPSLQLSGPDNGDCQSTLSGVTSFKIMSLDAGCAVTVYGVDSPFCDVNDNWVANLDQCYSNSSVSQYSIDGCNSVSSESSSSPFPSRASAPPTSSSTPSTFPSMPSTSPPAPSSSSPSSPSGNSSTGSSNNNGGGGGLTIKDQIIIGVILPSMSIIVAIIFGIRAWNNKK